MATATPTAAVPYLRSTAARIGSFVFHRRNNLFDGHRRACDEEKNVRMRVESKWILLMFIWMELNWDRIVGPLFDFISRRILMVASGYRLLRPK